MNPVTEITRASAARRGPDLSPIVVRFGALGDLILLTPLLHLLHQRFAKPCQLIGSGGWMQPLFARHPDVDSTWLVRSRRRPYLLDSSQWQLVSALRENPQSPVYVCDDHALDKVRWLLRRGGVSVQRCVFASEHHDQQGEHWNDRWMHFGQITPAAFNPSEYPCQSEDLLPAPKLSIDAVDRSDRDVWLQQHGLQNHDFLLLQIGNKRTFKRGRLGQFGDAKAWPIARWIGLLQALHTQLPQTRLILCGSPHEATLLRDVQKTSQLNCVQVAATDLPLRRLFSLLEIARGMISIDTGPAHAAAAFGCPLLVLYGAAPPAMWKPRSPTASDVVTVGGPPLSDHVQTINLETVLAAWKTIRLRTLLPDA
jgi:ADP-heptose:LPS heptosyltransferase